MSKYEDEYIIGKAINWLRHAQRAERKAGGSEGCFVDQMPAGLIASLARNNVYLTYIPDTDADPEPNNDGDFPSPPYV